MRDLSLPTRALKDYIQSHSIPLDCKVLAIGAGDDDAAIMRDAGLTNVTLSNVHTQALNLNAEDIDMPDDSFDMVFAHATLHHCRSPYKALYEMLRVARSWVVFFEPNDSFAARMSVKMGLKHAYEIIAVVDNSFDHGGVMNTDVPNFIHRWTPQELRKTALCAFPERQMEIYALPYWDFNLTERELDISDSGWRNVARNLQKLRGLLNLPLLRTQGNHFFGAVAKLGYQPWIVDGRYDQSYPAAANAAKNKRQPAA